jgi:hypothetical protein
MKKILQAGKDVTKGEGRQVDYCLMQAISGFKLTLRGAACKLGVLRNTLRRCG